jgi:hypothetical protein
VPEPDNPRAFDCGWWEIDDDAACSGAGQGVLERPINLCRVLAHTPELGRALPGDGSMDPVEGSRDAWLRELVILQVGMATGNTYKASHHVRILTSQPELTDSPQPEHAASRVCCRTRLVYWMRARKAGVR